MTYLSKLHGNGRSEAEAFFAEINPFPLAGASIAFLFATNLAATFATLLGQA